MRRFIPSWLYGIGAGVLLAVFAVGFQAYFTFTTVGGQNADGLGRILSRSPWLMRLVFGVEDRWPGGIWFLLDMVWFWSGVSAAIACFSTGTKLRDRWAQSQIEAPNTVRVLSSIGICGIVAFGVFAGLHKAIELGIDNRLGASAFPGELGPHFSGKVAGPLEDGLAAAKRGDYATTLRLLRPLADQDNAKAQFTLGFMYEEGRGVPQDYAEALKWYRKAADQGAADARVTLGVMYATGRGVPQDYAEALKWYRKAADQGAADAQFNLGIMYEKAEGVPQDYVQAHKWYNLAATYSPDPSEGEGRAAALRNRDRVAAKMTPAQIAEAQKLAREWKPGRAQTVGPLISITPEEYLKLSSDFQTIYVAGVIDGVSFTLYGYTQQENEGYVACARKQSLGQLAEWVAAWLRANPGFSEGAATAVAKTLGEHCKRNPPPD